MQLTASVVLLLAASAAATAAHRPNHQHRSRQHLVRQPVVGMNSTAANLNYNINSGQNQARPDSCGTVSVDPPTVSDDEPPSAPVPEVTPVPSSFSLPPPLPSGGGMRPAPFVAVSEAGAVRAGTAAMLGVVGVAWELL